MSCVFDRDKISGLADSELSAADALEVWQHLRSCDECDAYFQDILKLRETASRLPKYSAPAPVRQPNRPNLWVYGISTAACLAALTLWVTRPIPVAEAVQDHILALTSNHLVDVASSNHHTVKPWFAGKVHLAPKVLDLDADGFTLLGGRIDQISGESVPVLEFRRGAHLVSLFVTAKEPRNGPTRGFSVVTWRDQDLYYTAVSDSSVAELERFATLYQAK
ncbi:MAG: anti-sigma factor [Armatimonadetes bacterium]|nr:anti-sigma factor [Armatimonadota bacterium]